jgi:putative transposase
MNDSTYKRKSHIEISNLYFVTATIHSWNHLLLSNDFKNIVLQSMQWLSEKGKWDVFAFVIMPNHIHFIMRTIEMNGKESPIGSFLKYTAHEFKKMLLAKNDDELNLYKVREANKQFEFWQRDSLAVHLYSPQVAYQKLNYLHMNPLAEHWQLATDSCDYFYSSARFYEQGIKQFSFLKDMRNEF